MSRCVRDSEKEDAPATSATHHRRRLVADADSRDRMTDADLLRSLGVDPSQLDPTPPWASRQSAGAERLVGNHPCVRCGQPARATGVVTVPASGRRWLDRCMPCHHPRGGPRAPV